MAVTPQTWNGSSWVPASKEQFSYWNGTSWTAPSDVKHWNGSAWETIFPGIARRAAATGSAINTTDVGVVVPASVQAGDLLVLAVCQTANAVTLFNAISGWTKQGEQRAGGAAHTLAIYTRVAQAGDAGSTVTVTSTKIENLAAAVIAYSGVNQTTPLDTAAVFAQADPAVTTASAPAVTVATAGAMLVTFYSVPSVAGTTLSDADWTSPSGFSNELTVCSAALAVNNAALATYNMPSPGLGAQGPFAATLTQSRRWSLATLALRPA